MKNLLLFTFLLLVVNANAQSSVKLSPELSRSKKCILLYVDSEKSSVITISANRVKYIKGLKMKGYKVVSYELSFNVKGGYIAPVRIKKWSDLEQSSQELIKSATALFFENIKVKDRKGNVLKLTTSISCKVK